MKINCSHFIWLIVIKLFNVAGGQEPSGRLQQPPGCRGAAEHGPRCSPEARPLQPRSQVTAAPTICKSVQCAAAYTLLSGCFSSFICAYL